LLICSPDGRLDDKFAREYNQPNVGEMSMMTYIRLAAADWQISSKYRRCRAFEMICGVRVGSAFANRQST